MDLKDWASKQSKFVRLADGESTTGVFLKATEVEDSFNAGKTKIRYTLEIDGEQKIIESSSVNLARQMGAIEEGEIVKITRTGEGMNTRYSVGKVISKGVKDLPKEELD